MCHQIVWELCDRNVQNTIGCDDCQFVISQHALVILSRTERWRGEIERQNNIRDMTSLVCQRSVNGQMRIEVSNSSRRRPNEVISFYMQSVRYGVDESDTHVEFAINRSRNQSRYGPSIRLSCQRESSISFSKKKYSFIFCFLFFRLSRTFSQQSIDLWSTDRTPWLSCHVWESSPRRGTLFHRLGREFGW